MHHVAALLVPAVIAFLNTSDLEQIGVCAVFRHPAAAVALTLRTVVPGECALQGTRAEALVTTRSLSSTNQLDRACPFSLDLLQQCTMILV